MIGSAALVLSGCAVGLLLGRWIASSPAPVADQRANSIAQQPDLAPILAELQKLNGTLLLRASDQDVPSLRAPDSRVAVSHEPEVMERLTAAIETLNSHLQKLSGRPGIRSPVMESMKGAGFPSLEALWRRATALRHSGGQLWFDELGAELTTAHLAWLRDEVLERYGAPSAMRASEEGLNVVYKLDQRPGVASPVVVFETFDGLVREVFWSE